MNSQVLIDRIEKHAMLSKDCLGDSKVVLLSSIKRLLATPAPNPDAGEGAVAWPEGGSDTVEAVALGEFDKLGHPEHDLESWCAGYAEAIYKHATPSIVSALQASAKVVPDGWIAVSDRLPEVPEGEEQEVIVCVKRAHNGESYVFSARYLNTFLLYNDDIDDESTTATGWHDVKEHSEYDGWYSKLIDDGSGDEVTHWMPLAAAPAPGGGQ